ncbi:MAG: substrate-binding domain-containing protein [Roseiarcus sp.]|jgi:ABC-type sugar transport system substrate-binding protein
MNIIIDRRRLLFASGSLAVAGLVAGQSAFAANKPLVIATSLPSLAFPWYVHMNEGFQSEAKKLGDITLIGLDGQNSAAKQTADIESAITKKVDAILIAPSDVDALSPVLAQAITAGIPVVTVDRPTRGVQGILYHVGADNAKGGEVQGQAIMNAFPQGAKIFNLQGQLGSGNAIARSKGMHSVLDQHKDKYKFVFEQTANFSQSEALNVTEAGLSGQGKPDVIVTGNDDMALGAVAALQARNITDVAVFGFDAIPEALKLIKSGDMRATIEQYPAEQCARAARVAVAFLREGKKPDVAVDLLTPTLIAKENLSSAERIGEM